MGVQYVAVGTFRVPPAETVTWAPPVGFLQGILFVGSARGRLLGSYDIQVRTLSVTIVWPSTDFTLILT